MLTRVYRPRVKKRHSRGMSFDPEDEEWGVQWDLPDLGGCDTGGPKDAPSDAPK